MDILIKNGRAPRVKWICPKTCSRKTSHGNTRMCTCENPCTDSKYGRVTYTSPSKNLRLYPGTIRGTEEWNKIYKIRCNVEQTINHIKCNMGIARRKTRDNKTTKADSSLPVLLNYLQLLSQMQCPSLNTLEVSKNLLVNIWFSMFRYLC